VIFIEIILFLCCFERFFIQYFQSELYSSISYVFHNFTDIWKLFLQKIVKILQYFFNSFSRDMRIFWVPGISFELWEFQQKIWKFQKIPEELKIPVPPRKSMALAMAL
jgi:hypothetical protein